MGRWKRALGIGTTPAPRQSVAQCWTRWRMTSTPTSAVAKQLHRIAWLTSMPILARTLMSSGRRWAPESRSPCWICQYARYANSAARSNTSPTIAPTLTYICCRQCGNRWVALSQRPKRCKRCGRHDWDSYPCPVCGQMATDDHAVDHMRRAGAKVTPPGIPHGGLVVTIPGRAGEWRACVRCRAIRPIDMMREKGRCAICAGEQDSRPRPCPKCGAEITGYRRRRCDNCRRRTDVTPTHHRPSPQDGERP